MPYRKRSASNTREALKPVIVGLLVAAVVLVAIVGIQAGTDDFLDRQYRIQENQFRERKLRQTRYKDDVGTYTERPDGLGGTFTIPPDWRPNGDDYNFRKDW